MERHDCDSCNKKFVTRWRLEKHTKMHSNPKIKICRYVIKNEPCPFDKLGCKFKHVEPYKNDKVGHMEVKYDASSEVTNNKVEKGEFEKAYAFITSTPKKSVENYSSPTNQFMHWPSARMFTTRVGPPNVRTALCTLFLEEVSTGSMKLGTHLSSCCRGMLS